MKADDSPAEAAPPPDADAGPARAGPATPARRAGRKIDDVPGTITHRKVAEKFGITVETLREWVIRGSFPRPLAVIEQTHLYREDIIRTFLQTGKWPEDAEFNWSRGDEEG